MATLALTGCEIGSQTAPQTVYRAPSGGTSSVSAGSSTSAEVGTSLSVSVTVKDKSGYGISNVVPSVTAVNSIGSSIGITSGGCGVTNLYGVAACTISSSQAGTYTVKVTSPVTTSGPSVSFYQLPRSLSFVTEPGCAAAGCPAETSTSGVSSFATAPVVEILDKMGNLVTSVPSNDSLTNNITLSLSGGSGTLSGTTAVQPTAGESTFSLINVNLVGTYTLVATYYDPIVGNITGTSTSFTVIGSTAYQLVFTTEPDSSVSTNVNFTSMPAVQIEDIAGNPVTYTGGNCVITLALTAGDPSGTLLGTLSSTVSSTGLASFSSNALRINTTVGGTFTLTASASGVAGCSTLTTNSAALATPSNVSSAISVNLSGQPYQIAIVTGASTSPLNYTWATQPVVEVLDENGALVSSDNSTVVTVTASGGGGTLVGSSSITVVNGTASFSGLQIAGTSSADATTYTLSFVGTNPTYALTTAAVTTTVGINQNGLTPAKVAFSVQPQNVAKNQPMSAITVQSEDASGFFCFDDNTSVVNLKFLSGTASNGQTPHMYQNGTLVGGAGSALTFPLLVSNGLASFSGISFDQPGNYVIEAELSLNDGSTYPYTASSNTFAIANYGAADHLAFTREPVGSGSSNTAFSTQPIVSIEDAYGNVVTSSGTTYVVTINSTCVLPISNCSVEGNLSVTAVGGVASYSGLMTNQTGGTSGLVIEASVSPTLPSNNTGPFMSGSFSQ